MLSLFPSIFLTVCGRELFLSNASLFVDDEDADASEKYQRDEEANVTEQKVQNNYPAVGPSYSIRAVANSEEGVPDIDDDDDDDDDELDLDELNELEASLSRTPIQIQEPGK